MAENVLVIELDNSMYAVCRFSIQVETNQVEANPVKIARIGTAYLYKPRWQKQFRQTARGG
jgi:hypothetical protein